MMDYVKLTPEQEAARKKRNLTLALSVAGFIALVFIITVSRLGASVMERPL